MTVSRTWGNGQHRDLCDADVCHLDYSVGHTDPSQRAQCTLTKDSRDSDEVWVRAGCYVGSVSLSRHRATVLKSVIIGRNLPGNSPCTLLEC